MAFICGEHGDDIFTGDKAYGAWLPDADKKVVFCQRAFTAIPDDARHGKESSGDINIHTGTCMVNFAPGQPTSVSWFIEYSGRLFFISPDDLRRCLPGVARMLLG